MHACMHATPQALRLCPNKHSHYHRRDFKYAVQTHAMAAAASTTNTPNHHQTNMHMNMLAARLRAATAQHR
jgi:hypothetical protein